MKNVEIYKWVLGFMGVIVLSTFGYITNTSFKTANEVNKLKDKKNNDSIVLVEVKSISEDLAGIKKDYNENQIYLKQEIDGIKQNQFIISQKISMTKTERHIVDENLKCALSISLAPTPEITEDTLLTLEEMFN